MRGAVFFLLLLISNASLSEIYKWTDEAGRVHFGDKAPQGKSEKIDIRESSSSTAKNTGAYSKDRSKENIQRFLKAIEEEKAITLEKENEKALQRQEMRAYCQRLEKEINIYNKGYAIVRYGQDGAHEYLTDQEIDARKALFRKNWQENCEGL